MTNPWKRRVEIGEAVLYEGDCLEVMPTLGQVDAVVACCDAVVYTDIHGKTANWEPETPARCGVDMGKPQGGNNGLVYQWANVTGAAGGSLRDEPARDCASIETNGHQAQVAGKGGRAERSIHRRDAKHDLSNDGGESLLQQMRSNGSTRCASCGRGPHEQRGRKFGSALQPLPFQPSQAGMVALPEGFGVLTDPPYGIGQDGGRGHRKKSRARVQEKKGWDRERPSRSVFEWLQSAPAGSIIWGGNYFADYLPPRMGWLYWQKLIGGDFSAGELAWTSRQGALREFIYRKTNAEMEHPTQKPVALMEWCLGFLPNAETVLDCYMGSGTTGVACVNLGRKFIGIELDPGYFDIACKRIQEAYKQPRLFDEPPPKPVQERML
jgi:hypothetical protein